MHTFARAGVIIEKDGSFLFMKRTKQGRTYYAVLGGHPENNETPEETAVREIQEETGLTVTIGDIIYITSEYPSQLPGYYYWATSIEGKAELGGPEKGYSTPENHFELAWIKKENITTIALYPTQVHEYLIKNQEKENSPLPLPKV